LGPNTAIFETLSGQRVQIKIKYFKTLIPQLCFE